MAEQLASPLAVAFTWMLLHFLWQGSAIAIAYWLLFGQPATITERRKSSGSAALSRSSSDRSRRSATNRYAVSLSMLAAMAICPIATFVWLYDPNATIEQPVVVDRWNTTDDRIVMPLSSRSDSIAFVADEPSSEFASDKQHAIAPAVTIDFDSIHTILDRWQPYLLLLWGLGVVFSGLRLAAGFLNIVWLRSGTKPIPDALKQRSVLLARKLGLNVSRVFSSSRIHEAAVVGFWRPVVLLPTAWLASLPPDVLEAVIAHELAHIRRLDVWVNLMQRLLESLFFYHPAVWWLSNRVRLEREMCCDELAVQVMGNRGQYAIALEQVGRMQVFGTPSLATSFRGDGKMKLYRRIQNILGTSNVPAREPAFLVGIALAAVTLVLTGVIGNGVRSNIATAQDREPKSSEPDRSEEKRAVKPQQEERTPLSDREKKLTETIEKLQQELNELRSKVRGEYPGELEEEFRSYDRNGDSKIERDEWFDKFVSEIPQAIHALSQVKKLKERRDELMKMKSVDEKEMQDLNTQISTWEKKLTQVDALFWKSWNQVDSDRSDYVTHPEFARWWKPAEQRRLDANRPSQILRREQLEPLIDRRKMLLERYSQNHPSVNDLTIRIKSFEERIRIMEEAEEKVLRERMRSLDDARARELREREGMRPGPREGEGGVRGPRDGEKPNSGPRDGDRTSKGPRDGEKRGEGPREGDGNVRSPRDGESTKLGPRDGESSRVIFPAKKSEK